MDRSDGSGEGYPFYLVDGYNVIFGARFEGKNAGVEDSRERFLGVLDSYRRRKKVEIVVVWDGKGPDAGGRSVKSLSTVGGGSADERIVRIVERSANRSRITVVSDDRRHIVGVVRSLGAKSMGVDEFLGMVGFSGKSATKRGPGASRRSTRGARASGNDSACPDAEASGGARMPTDTQAEKRPAGGLSVEEWLKLFKAKE